MIFFILVAYLFGKALKKLWEILFWSPLIIKKNYQQWETWYLPSFVVGYVSASPSFKQQDPLLQIDTKITIAFWKSTVRPTRQAQNKRQRFVENERLSFIFQSEKLMLQWI